MNIDLNALCRERYDKTCADCDDDQIFMLLCQVVQAAIKENKRVDGNDLPKKKLYYLCAEFLMGRMLFNHLINLGLYESVRRQLLAAGKNPALIEEREAEPALGNGGLGRLAACFLDSIATQKFHGDGVGLRYHFGLFRQRFVDKKQTELPDPWLNREPLLRRREQRYTVECMGVPLYASLYDMDVIGYGGHVNTLHLFDVESACEGEMRDGIAFDASDITHNLTLFLYPDDSTPQGRRLRLCQQYFLVSCAAQMILEECAERGCRWDDLDEYAVIQINDTHPALIIPVLVQQLVQRGLTMAKAVAVVTRCCAYTNHTVMAEALECWPLDMVAQVAPSLIPILQAMHKAAEAQVKARGGDAQRTAIIDANGLLHMAHLAVHFSFSVNGVAKVHSALLRTQVLPSFYAVYPERFGNKTNGITPRRWLLGCNHPLYDWIRERIGEGFLTDANRLRGLIDYADNEQTLDALLEVKQNAKQALCDYLARTRGIVLSSDAVFDIQMKRLHEYKRQQLAALYLIDKLHAIRQGERLPQPLVAIFAAKAAPSYRLAKDIIHLLLCLQEVTAKDEQLHGQLRVVVVEDYNVSAAQMLVPACDISEQISLASKEASGTGNMKLMMNGALTLGTRDGANVEIAALVGEDNVYLFGATSEEVVALEKAGTYDPAAYYASDERLRRALDYLLSEELGRIGDRVALARLHEALIDRDRFMALMDFESYRACRDRALEEYGNARERAKKMLYNIAYSGYFSSDRTIAEYNRDIWKLEKEE